MLLSFHHKMRNFILFSLLLFSALDVTAQEQYAPSSDIYQHNLRMMKELSIKYDLGSRIDCRPYLCIICAKVWGIVIDNGETYRLYYDRCQTTDLHYSYQDISKENRTLKGLFSALNADIGNRTTLNDNYNPFTEFIIAQSGSATPIFSQSGYKFVFRHSDNPEEREDELRQEKNLTEGINAVLAYIVGEEHILLNPKS